MPERNLRPIRPIVGHHAGWGLFKTTYRPEPYALPEGATDTMQVRVREKIDIHGVGTDVIEMVGTFTVRRDHPRRVDGTGDAEMRLGQNAEIKAEFRSLELYGESEVFGTVRARLNPTQAAQAIVGPSEDGSLAAKCKAEMYPVIELPELGLTLSTGDQPVSLASKVIQVPPVGDVARSENSVALMDENGEELGEIVSADIEVGEVLFSIPLGRTERRIQ